ncbi:MAG: pirin family protein [Bradymonadia bacterium]
MSKPSQTEDVSRRDFMKAVAATSATVSAVGCSTTAPEASAAPDPQPDKTSSNTQEVQVNADQLIQAVEPLTFPWQTSDPFLFCAHHDDAYPKGNEKMGPAVSLAGRRIGMDFGGKDGWSMYHGEEVPGFPQHPHRGFETVTLARKGFIDHSDSMGATARFGTGDAQWMTAGRGIVHAEMFPLRSQAEDNPCELFQIWLNLPKANKMVEPHFTMLWREGIPTHALTDDAGRAIEITTVAGALDGQVPQSPPPSSWASRPEAKVAIWTMKLDPGTRWVMPEVEDDVERSLYVFLGDTVKIAGREVKRGHRVVLAGGLPVPIEAGAAPVQMLLLQGRPIKEPIARRGPFVMNTPNEIRQAFVDYQRTRFGGWPWPRPDPVHQREEGRFALHADGRVERKG